MVDPGPPWIMITVGEPLPSARQNSRAPSGIVAYPLLSGTAAFVPAAANRLAAKTSASMLDAGYENRCSRTEVDLPARPQSSSTVRSAQRQRNGWVVDERGVVPRWQNGSMDPVSLTWVSPAHF